MMTITAHRLTTLVALLGLAACGESGTDVLAEHFTAGELAELAVVADVASLDVAVEINAVTNDVAADFGVARVADGRSLSTAAAAGFAAARAAWLAGDQRRAIEEAREARGLLGRSLLATGGPDAIAALIERIEELALETDSEDDDVFDDPEGLRSQLSDLAATARDRLAQGDSAGAADRALLGEQIARHHRGRRHFRGDIVPERARLAVALAGTAVALAERLVNAEDTPVRDASTDVRERQNRWLEHAKRMLARAEMALATGHFARAVHVAEHAHWSALKAAILPGGITHEELRAMVALAHHLLEEAKVALGDDPTPLELRLFERAGRLIDLGERMLANGNKRGVAPVWRGAVISRWLMN